MWLICNVAKLDWFIPNTGDRHVYLGHDRDLDHCQCDLHDSTADPDHKTWECDCCSRSVPATPATTHKHTGFHSVQCESKTYPNTGDRAAVEQLLGRWTGNPVVTGSNAARCCINAIGEEGSIFHFISGQSSCCCPVDLGRKVGPSAIP